MAFTFDPNAANNEVKAVESGKKLRIGIVGCGGIAHNHMRSYLKMPDVEIVAGCDLVPGRAKAFFEEFKVEGVRTDFKDCDDMISHQDELKLDAVSVCTYNRQHAPCTIACLNAGIHVLLEKPFSVTTEEAVEMMRAERVSGKVLSIGFQPRLDENMKMIKKIVESGELGKIYYIQTGGGRRRGIPVGRGTSFIEDATAGLGALADIGCYSLDMVLNAIGYPKPLTVTGYKSDFFGKDPNYVTYVQKGHPEYAEKFGVDDFAAAFIRLEGGIILDFRISWAINIDTPGDTLILGTKGGLRIPSTDCWNGTVGGPMKIYSEVCGEQTCKVVPIIPADKDVSLFDKKIRSFLDACKGIAPVPVPTSQILYNQAIIDGIARSSDAGKEIEIVIPEV